LAAVSRPVAVTGEGMAAAGAAVVGIEPSGRPYFQRIACFSMQCQDRPASANVTTVQATT
jgi:hypothetical protein